MKSLPALLAVAAWLALGTYLVAVLDALLGRLVAGEPARPGGSLAAPLRSAAGLLLSERSRTERPDSPAWMLAPALLGALAAVALTSVPFSPSWAPADVEGGILLFVAAVAVVMVAVFLHGWSANSLMPLVGGYRFVAQALSYGIPLGLAVLAPALPAQSLAVAEIVRAQEHLWNVLRQPLGLPVYLVVGLGIAFWGPLALPDGADLAGGTSAEASGAALLAWKVARAGVLVAVAAMGAAAFLGGWWGPWLPGPAWVAAKTLALLVVLLLAGHLLGRVRAEGFVTFAWTVLIPLALVNIFAAGVLLL